MLPAATPSAYGRGSIVPVCLLALAVAALAASVALLVADRLEQREFDSLVQRAQATRPGLPRPSDADVLHLMHTVHNQLQGTPLHPSSSLNSRLNITSSHEQLANPSGMCASYSHVLAKALMTAGYQVRKVGLAKNGKRAIHHVIEARQGSSWTLLDAYYDLAYRAPDGHLASAADVSRHWTTYRRQVPAGYNPDFDYSSFYYTNWDRIPVVGWIVRASPPLASWLHERGISIRFWFFNTYRWQAGLCAALGILCLALRHSYRRRCR